MPAFRFGAYQFNHDQTLWLGDSLVHLAPMQRRLLDCFCRHPRQVLSKQKLMLEVWGHQEVSEVSLARTVHGLRRKLVDASLGGEVVRNVYAEGYIFTPQVVELQDSSSTSPRTTRSLAV